MKLRELKISYEINRTSDVYLADAYEQITRIIKKEVHFNVATHDENSQERYVVKNEEQVK
jgi:hypothetical protein